MTDPFAWYEDTTFRRLLGQFDVRKKAAEGHPLLRNVKRSETFGSVNLISPVFTTAIGTRGPFWNTRRACEVRTATFSSMDEGVERVLKVAREIGQLLSDAMYRPTCEGFDPLDAWVPATAPPPGDIWRGVDRSRDHIRLAGQRLMVSGMLTEEAFAEADARAEVEGAEDGHDYYLNPETYDRIPKHARRGTMIRDESCPRDVVWRIPDRCLSLVGCCGLPMILDFDGNMCLRSTKVPGQMEVRVGFFGNTLLQNPSHVVRIMGLELQKPVSASVPAQLSADSCDPYEVRAGYWMQKAGAVTVVSAANSATQATTIAPAEDIVCRNKTCGKKCDAGSKKCWNCELVF